MTIIYMMVQRLCLFLVVAAFLLAGCAHPGHDHSATAQAATLYHASHEHDGHEHKGHGEHDHCDHFHFNTVEDETRTVEVFTGGCELCRQALLSTVEIAKKMKFNVVEYKIDGPEAKKYGLKSAPSIVYKGRILFSELPDPKELEKKLKAEVELDDAFAQKVD